MYNNNLTQLILTWSRNMLLMTIFLSINLFMNTYTGFKTLFQFKFTFVLQFAVNGTRFKEKNNFGVWKRLYTLKRINLHFSRGFNFVDLFIQIFRRFRGLPNFHTKIVR